MNKTEKLNEIKVLITKEYQLSTSQEEDIMSRRYYEEVLRRIAHIVNSK